MKANPKIDSKLLPLACKQNYMAKNTKGTGKAETQTTVKPRAKKYDEKLKINGTFDELLKSLATPPPPVSKPK